MKKSIFRLILRKIRGHLPQLLGMGLLVVIGVAFFVTLYTIFLSYEYNAEQLFAEQNYADVTYYGDFDECDVEKILAWKGIETVQGRRVQDFKDGDITLRVVSLTNGINIPYLYDGRLPQASDECLLLKKHAQAKDIKQGDKLTVDGKILRVTGIVASPEYVYLVQNERALMAQSDRFGVVFVSEGFFDTPYNEIVATGNVENDSLKSAGNLVDAVKTVVKTDQTNYNLYREDLNQIRTFAYIFPVIFALLIVLIIYVMLKRTIVKERHQIGVYKALGVEGSKIIFIYVAQSASVAFVGAVIGCIVAMLLCDTIIGFFSVMFEVPGLAFEFYPSLWISVIMISASVCVISALVSVWSVFKPLPAELLRSRMPSGVKALLLEKVPFLWNRISFNTRYALKSTFRNKGRFLAVVLGMCGSCALLTFAFGFFDSVKYTQDTYFHEFARYDVLMEFDPIPLTMDHPVTERLDRTNKALAMPIKINDGEYRLIIVEEDFDMQNIETENLKNGVIVPDYYAKKWDVGIGDKLGINDTDVEITGLSEQSFGMSVYASYHYVKKMFPNLPPVYNVIFAQNRNMEEFEDWSRQYGFQYSTREDDRTSLAFVMESLNVLIWFMLACAVILGLTVLYSVGLMNLSSREYEYMFMGVMGYPLKSIMLSHCKETVLQLFLAIPFGFLLGNGILNMVKTEFSGDNFVISTAIFVQSYFFSGIIVVFMAIIMAFVSARHISRLDIVEGLKARDE